MIGLTLQTAKAVIAGALEGKYDDFLEDEFERALVKAWETAVDAPSEAALLKLLRPTVGLATDVTNHVIALHLIERFWREKAGMSAPITRMHQAVYGISNSTPEMRQTEFVGDFGGIVPTAIPNVMGALAELELVVARLTPIFGGQSIATQTVYLAHVFSSVIRVHPFHDGNGRTARLIVQYCLRCWGRPYVPLPKVRNEPSWRDALERAVAGDISALVKEFMRRMNGVEWD
jgi:hypothetical protein